MNIFLNSILGLGFLAVTGCVSVGPDYAKPTNEVHAATYKLLADTNQLGA